MDKFRNKYRIPSARWQKWDYGWSGAYFITICTRNRKHFFGEIINGEMSLSEIGEIAKKFLLEIPERYEYARLDEYVVMPNHVHAIVIIDKEDDGRFGGDGGYGGKGGCCRVDGVNGDGIGGNLDGGDMDGVYDNDGGDWDGDGNNNNGSENDGGDWDDGGCDNVGGDWDGDGGGNNNGGCDNGGGDLDGDGGGNTNGGCDNGGGDLDHDRDAINRVSTEPHPRPQPHPYTQSPPNTKKRGGITGNKNPMLHDNISRIFNWYTGRVTYESHKIDKNYGWQARFHDHVIRNNIEYLRIRNYIINNPYNWNSDGLKPQT